MSNIEYAEGMDILDRNYQIMIHFLDHFKEDFSLVNIHEIYHGETIEELEDIDKKIRSVENSMSRLQNDLTALHHYFLRSKKKAMNEKIPTDEKKLLK